MLHNGNWWRLQTKRMVFNGPDKNDAAAFNRLLWKGIVGDAPYPDERNGLDLSVDRAQVLSIFHVPVPLQ
jgi:hypothetical protein